MKKVIIPYIPKFLILAASMLPVVSKAAFILDTGTPTATGGPLIVSSAQSLAGEFSATAGETITQLSAYLAPGTGNGNSLVFDLYSGPITGRSTIKNLVDSTTATFGGTTGWTSVSVDWPVLTSGNYWFAIGVNGSGTTFDAPLETSTTTGTAPAAAFASANSGGTYSSLSSGIGLEVSAVVPEPVTYGSIAGAGLLALAVCKPMRRSFQRQGKIDLCGRQQ
jgi:hypothetical protein